MCKCVERINANLKPFNTVLSEVSMLNMKTGNCRQSLQIVSQKIDTARRAMKAKTVLPTFCPFCGKRCTPASRRKP